MNTIELVTRDHANHLFLEGETPPLRTEVEEAKLRVAFARAALTGLISNPINKGSAQVFAETAVDAADALIERLKQ